MPPPYERYLIVSAFTSPQVLDPCCSIQSKFTEVHTSPFHHSLFNFSGSQPIWFVHRSIYNLESFLLLSDKEKNNQPKKNTNKNDVNVQKWHFAQAIVALGFAALTNHIMALGFSKEIKDMKFLLMEWNEPVKFLWKLAAYLDTSNPNYCDRIYNVQFTVLCKSNANELRQISWLFEEISLRTKFPRTFEAPIVLVRRNYERYFAVDARELRTQEGKFALLESLVRNL